MARAPRQTGTRLAQALLAGALILLAGACAGKKKAVEAGPPTAEAIYRQGMEQLQKRDLRKAQSLFEQVQYSPENREKLEPLVRLGLADIAFYQRQDLSLIDARSMYLDFVTLYGAHPLAPYALYQAGVASALQVSHPTKDQSIAFQALADLTQVENRFPDSSFADAARRTIFRAENALAEHDFLVGRFYMKRKLPMAAAERFQRILDRYPRYREKDKLYFYLGQALLRANNQVEARIYLDKLVTDYPYGKYYDDAMKELDKTGGRMERLELSGSP